MDRMHWKPKRRILPCAVLAFSTGLSLAGTPAAASSVVGEQLPEFELKTMDGSLFSSRELAGKVAVVDLWSTWCGPCLKDIPNLNELSRHFKNEEFAVVGVTLQSGWAQDIKKDLETRNIQAAYAILVGDDDVEEAFGGVLAFPTTLLVGRDGRIRKKYVGADDDKAAGMEREIRALLAEPQPPTRIGGKTP